MWTFFICGDRYGERRAREWDGATDRILMKVGAARSMELTIELIRGRRRAGSRPCMNCEWAAKVRRTIRFSWRSRNVFDNWGPARLIEKAHQTDSDGIFIEKLFRTTELCKRSHHQQPMHENHLSSQPYASFVTSSSLSSPNRTRREQKSFLIVKNCFCFNIWNFLCYVFWREHGRWSHESVV